MKSLNEKGYALFLTILTLLLVSILGFSILTVSGNSLKTSTSERSSQSLFYLAEAGLNYKEAIILNEINRIYEEEKNNPSNKTGNEETFNTNFDNRINSLLLINSFTTLNETYFTNLMNGKPTVKVSIFPNGSSRKFKIQSEASYSGNPAKRKVERMYEISSDLLNLNVVEVPVSPGSAPSSYENVVINNSEISYKGKDVNLYIKDAYFLGAQKSELKHAAFKATFKKDYAVGRIYNTSVRDLFYYKETYPSLPVDTLQYNSPPTTASSPSNEINLNSALITMSSDLKMKKLPNLSNKIININIPSGEYDLVFTDNFLNYNLSSLRFNVTGNGKLNIVFNKYFDQNAYTKFIVNAPTTKVNLIFKNGASIRGEMVAQDIFINGNFTLTSINSILNKNTPNGVLVADNINISNGNFDKTLHSQAKIKNLYIQKGNLLIGSPTIREYLFYADNITLLDGSINIRAGGELNVTNNIFVHKGELNSLATTCVQANQIVVPNNDTRFDDEANFSVFYGKKLYMIVSSKVNKTICGNNNTYTVSKEIQDDTPQFIIEIQYNYKESDIIKISNLIEVKN